MELTRSQQQHILDTLARLRGEQLGIELQFILKEPEQIEEQTEAPMPYEQ